MSPVDVCGTRLVCPRSCAGNIKLGDFGLAKDKITRVDSKESLTKKPEVPHVPHLPMSISMSVRSQSEDFNEYDDSFTTGVGTRLYSAPEQSSQPERK